MKKKTNSFPIEEKTVFNFAVRENAERVAIALCSAGHFVIISSSSSGYLVYVYSIQSPSFSYKLPTTKKTR